MKLKANLLKPIQGQQSAHQRIQYMESVTVSPRLAERPLLP